MARASVRFGQYGKFTSSFMAMSSSVRNERSARQQPKARFNPRLIQQAKFGCATKSIVKVDKSKCFC
jgi:hypothetical protein